MTIKDQIQQDTKDALRAGDRDRLGVLRMAMAAIKQREVDERVEMTDADVLSVLEKMVKQRRESVSQFEAGARRDLADKERAEIGILQAYLPEPLSDAELDALIAELVAETGADSVRDMGKVMGLLKTRAQGRVDMGAASARVRAALGA
jgi:uncharacterized protein YqeY